MPHAVDRGQVLYAGARPRYYAGRFSGDATEPCGLCYRRHSALCSCRRARDHMELK